MKKKATARKIVSIALMTIVGLVVLFIVIGNISPKFREITRSWTKNIVQIGQPEVKPFESTPPPNVELAFDSLVRVFNKWKDEPAQRCLIKYPEFMEFENNCNIIMEYDIANTKLRMEIQCPDEYNIHRIVKSIPLESRPDIIPCIVAGREAADNFFYNWIDKETPEKFPETSTFSYDKAIITDEETLAIRNNKYDLEDEGLSDFSGQISYLYKTRYNQICFFTTNQYKNHDEDGIDDDYVKKMANYVPLCKEET